MKIKKNTTKEFSLSPLSVTGKPLHIHSFSESKPKLGQRSFDLPLQKNPFYQIDKTPNFLNSSQIKLLNLKTTNSKKDSSKFRSHHSVTKSATTEPFELDSSTKIYKCMSNPNVNGNSSVYGLPIRVLTAETEAFVYRPSSKNKIGSKGLKRLKFTIRQDSISVYLQKSNGIVCNEEDIGYKYYVGPGNNSSLIIRVMKSRTRWKRTFSSVLANFSWTALNNYSIFDSLNSYALDGERTAVQVKSSLPEIIPDHMYCHLVPSMYLQSGKQKLYNKLLENKELTSKKALFFNMQSYYSALGTDPFSKIPLTFHVTHGSSDSSFQVFTLKFLELQNEGKPNIWIVKPGEFTNRGIGINVCSNMAEIIGAVNNKKPDYERSFIIQKYIDNPFLYNGRKFDIRVFAMVSCIQGNIQAYYYKEGYLRTSGVSFDLNDVDNKFIHLTNDAVQKYDSNYGKHEAGNKLSYLEFQNYLDRNHPTLSFFDQALPQIKELVTETIQATYLKLDPEKKLHSFEVLGYDFIIDSDFKVWLIEVNTNPCLELSSPYLSILIPKMVENAFSLTVDQLFPHDSSALNSFVMIFNESTYLKGSKL